MEAQRIKVLFIGGYGRSGSTLLSLLLEQLPGFCSAGELYQIWARGYSKDLMCNCGHTFKACGFWDAVTAEALGNPDETDIEAIKETKHAVERLRLVPQIVFPYLRTREYRRQYQKHTDTLLRLYRAIRNVSGCNVIVDLSKSPLYGLLLSSMSEIDLSVVHLVRDSRAVAYSWQRKKIGPEQRWTYGHMPTYKTSRSALEWNLNNALTHVLKVIGSNYVRLRYEDLVANTDMALRRILSLMDKEIVDPSFLSDAEIELCPGHMMGGNPMRFQKGPITVKLDDKWQETMDRKKKRMVTVLTLPFLLYYGYR